MTRHRVWARPCACGCDTIATDPWDERLLDFPSYTARNIRNLRDHIRALLYDAYVRGTTDKNDDAVTEGLRFGILYECGTNRCVTVACITTQTLFSGLFPLPVNQCSARSTGGSIMTRCHTLSVHLCLLKPHVFVLLSTEGSLCNANLSPPFSPVAHKNTWASFNGV